MALIMVLCNATAQRSVASKVGQPKVFTVVYATSDDGFLNVREKPSVKSKILGQLYGQVHGLGTGVLLEKGNTWSKVTVGDVTGWVYNKYLGYQTWYDGKGKITLIAGRENMPIYGEDYVGEGNNPIFTTVKKGTKIADHFNEDEGYYVLLSGHDYLFIKKQDVKLEKK